MRTTLTIDDDVAVVIERLRAERKLSLKELVNQALRQGLRTLEEKRPTEPFVTKSVSAGGFVSPGVDWIKDVLREMDFEDDMRKLWGDAGPKDADK